MVGMLAEGVEVHPRSSTLIKRLNQFVPTKGVGIDPYPLARGIKRIGVENAVEYREASIDLLTELLTVDRCFCALLIQAPWARYDHVKYRLAGHNVVAGHFDTKTKMISGFEPGNGNRWFQIAATDLDQYYWTDRAIRSPKVIFDHWMLHMPIKKQK